MHEVNERRRKTLEPPVEQDEDDLGDDTTAAYERLARAREEARYVLRLYVTGMTPRSLQAVANLRAICEVHLAGRYDLEVIDIRERPQLTRDEQVIAAPTLVKKLPLPIRRIVGDLSDVERVLFGLDLRPAPRALPGTAEAQPKP
jgi:circadian clock protein KaiB